MVCLYIVRVCWNSCLQARLYNHVGFVAIRGACTPWGTDQRWHWPAGSCKVQHLQLLGEAVLWPAVRASSVAGCPSLCFFSVDHEVPLAAATTFRTLSSFACKRWSRYLKKVLPRLSWVMTVYDRVSMDGFLQQLIHCFVLPDSRVVFKVLEAWRRHSNGLCNEPILVTDENVREIIPDIPEDPLKRISDKGPLEKSSGAPDNRAPTVFFWCLGARIESAAMS